jgi:hypothetical protein
MAQMVGSSHVRRWADAEGGDLAVVMDPDERKQIESALREALAAPDLARERPHATPTGAEEATAHAIAERYWPMAPLVRAIAQALADARAERDRR